MCRRSAIRCMGNSHSGDGKPRDEESQRFVPEKPVRELLDIFEEKDGEATTSEVAEELDYSHAGAYKRLSNESDYFEKREVGNSILWTLKYDRKEFIEAMDELDDLTRTDQIADYVGCSEEVAREWMFKLEDEGVYVSMPMGEGEGLIWAKEP